MGKLLFKITFFVILNYLIILNLNYSQQFNLSITNNNNNFIIPNKPGIEYEYYNTPLNSSIYSKIPSSLVQVKSIGSEGQLLTLNLDGGLSSHTKLALDGLIFESGQITPMDASILPIEFSEITEIYKNNLSSYGILSPTGIINFKLPDNYNDKIFSINLGSLINSSLMIIYPIILSDINLLYGGAITYSSNNFFYTKNNQIYQSANLNYYKYSLINKIKYKNITSTITYNYKSCGTGTKFMGTPRQNDSVFTSFIKLNNYPLDIELSYVYWYNNYLNNILRTDDKHYNNTLNLKLDYKHNYNKIILNTIFLNKTYLLSSSKISNYNYIFNNEFDLIFMSKISFEKITLNLNLNNILNYSIGYFLIPEFSYSYNFSKELQLIFNISRLLRIPTFNELYWEEDGFSKGNPDLIPEDGIQFKTGLLYSILPFYISFYYTENNYNNIILWKPDDNGKWKPNNQEKVLSRIANLSFNYKDIIYNFLITSSLSISYQYTINNNQNSLYYKKYLTYTPFLKITFNTSIEFYEDLLINLSTRFVSERYINELNNLSLPYYFITDFYIKYKFLFLSIENVFDYNYQEIDGYPLPGRILKGGIYVKF